jgi:hypothetical protein
MPRDAEIVELFKKLNAAARCRRDSV